MPLRKRRHRYIKSSFPTQLEASQKDSDLTECSGNRKGAKRKLESIQLDSTSEKAEAEGDLFGSVSLGGPDSWTQLLLRQRSVERDPDSKRKINGEKFRRKLQKRLMARSRAKTKSSSHRDDSQAWRRCAVVSFGKVSTWNSKKYQHVCSTGMMPNTFIVEAGWFGVIKTCFYWWRTFFLNQFKKKDCHKKGKKNFANHWRLVARYNIRNLKT